MERTTLSIPNELRARLKRLAADRGVSMATIIREALEQKVAGWRPRPSSLGVGASGVADTAGRSADERAEPRAWR